MKIASLLLFIAFIFSGCVSKKVLFEEDLRAEQALVNSKSVQIKEGEKVVAYLIVTYLNEIQSEYIPNTKNDKFLIALYKPQEVKDIGEIEFSINSDTNNTIVKKLEKDDKLLTILSNRSIWNSYYLLEIFPQKKRTLSVEFKAKEYQKTGVIFNKSYF